MTTPFEIIKSSAECAALLGASPTRFTPFGLAEQNGARPFCTYQLIGGTPYHQLACPADADNVRYQIDVYADTAELANKTFIAVRDALEADNHVTVVSYNGDDYESDTQLYRISFDIDFITSH